MSAHRQAIETDDGTVVEYDSIHAWVGAVTGRAVSTESGSTVIVYKTEGGDWVTVLRHPTRLDTPVDETHVVS